MTGSREPTAEVRAQSAGNRSDQVSPGDRSMGRREAAHRPRNATSGPEHSTDTVGGSRTARHACRPSGVGAGDQAGRAAKVGEPGVVPVRPLPVRGVSRSDTSVKFSTYSFSRNTTSSTGGSRHPIADRLRRSDHAPHCVRKPARPDDALPWSLGLIRRRVNAPRVYVFAGGMQVQRHPQGLLEPNIRHEKFKPEGEAPVLPAALTLAAPTLLPGRDQQGFRNRPAGRPRHGRSVSTVASSWSLCGRRATSSDRSPARIPSITRCGSASSASASEVSPS